MLRSHVTYNLPDGRCIDLSRRDIALYGAAEVARMLGVNEAALNSRVNLWQHGQIIGSLPRLFTPQAAQAFSPFYTIREGDFTMRPNGDWEACRTLGPGDIACVHGYSSRRV